MEFIKGMNTLSNIVLTHCVVSVMSIIFLQRLNHTEPLEIREKFTQKGL